MAVTFLSLLESQEWLELVKGRHDQSVLHYQQLLVKYVSAWSSDSTCVQGRSCEGEDGCPGGALRKRLKKLQKAQDHAADIPTSRILAEILATSPNDLPIELLRAHKWMVEQLPQTVVAAVDHFLTFCPSTLAPLDLDNEWAPYIPVSLVLKDKLLGWSLVSGIEDGSPPQSKRKRRDQREAAGVSLTPISPSGLLEEMLGDEAFEPQVIAAAKHSTSPTDLTHSVYVLRSLLLLALRKLKEGTASVASCVQTVMTVATLMKAIFCKLNNLLVQNGIKAKRSETLLLGEGLSALFDGVFSHSLLSVPLQFALMTSTEDTRLSLGKKRRQKHTTVNAKHAGLQMAELLAFCAHLCPSWRASQTFQTLLKQSTAGLERQITAGTYVGQVM